MQVDPKACNPKGQQRGGDRERGGGERGGGGMGGDGPKMNRVRIAPYIMSFSFYLTSCTKVASVAKFFLTMQVH